METKTCPRCKNAFPIEEGFYRNRSEADGRQTYCKGCVLEIVQEYKQANPDHVRAVQIASYHRNKETINPRRNARRRKAQEAVTNE